MFSSLRVRLWAAFTFRTAHQGTYSYGSFGLQPTPRHDAIVSKTPMIDHPDHPFVPLFLFHNVYKWDLWAVACMSNLSFLHSIILHWDLHFWHCGVEYHLIQLGPLETSGPSLSACLGIQSRARMPNAWHVDFSFVLLVSHRLSLLLVCIDFKVVECCGHLCCWCETEHVLLLLQPCRRTCSGNVHKVIGPSLEFVRYLNLLYFACFLCMVSIALLHVQLLRCKILWSFTTCAPQHACLNSVTSTWFRFSSCTNEVVWMLASCSPSKLITRALWATS